MIDIFINKLSASKLIYIIQTNWGNCCTIFYLCCFSILKF